MMKNILEEIIKNKKKRLYFKFKKNLVGIDIKPEFPDNSDIKVLNNFKKPTNNLSNSILKKIKLLYKK